MSRVGVALLAVLVAPAALAYPTPLGEVDPAFFVTGGGAASALVSSGSWTASPNEFLCPGATYDILVVFASVGDQGVAAVVSDSRDPACAEVWPPMLLRGNWGTGWEGECPPVGSLCDLLTLGPYAIGQRITVALDGGNGVRRSGSLDSPLG